MAKDAAKHGVKTFAYSTATQLGNLAARKAVQSLTEKIIPIVFKSIAGGGRRGRRRTTARKGRNRRGKRGYGKAKRPSRSKTLAAPYHSQSKYATRERSAYVPVKNATPAFVGNPPYGLGFVWAQQI